ncbi:hypothetical protein GGTG_00613 [Gaeumannomyces tritici R3-111a-1]|uniref:Uncharacterized protein n=1 Tax=Gaeumannomyces tritici (strain R3-111a-1) TaxID=644352 RepID=J3NH75_GAET3|nr:hypothetical protein GGTG_00613 [Gaeumannomyces tritici R3-111a-1]EJT80618.1 hypothetical protein GGTG_00613 [Gaeumannomyces tritici R3-111a-1]
MLNSILVCHIGWDRGREHAYENSPDNVDVLSGRNSRHESGRHGFAVCWFDGSPVVGLPIGSSGAEDKAGMALLRLPPVPRWIHSPGKRGAQPLWGWEMGSGGVLSWQKGWKCRETNGRLGKGTGGSLGSTSTRGSAVMHHSPI